MPSSAWDVCGSESSGFSLIRRFSFLVAPLAVVERLKLVTFSLVRAHMGEIPRPVTERGAVSRTPPACWLDGAPLGDKTHQKIFDDHVFDTVLSEIPQDWGLGAFQ